MTNIQASSLVKAFVDGLKLLFYISAFIRAFAAVLLLYFYTTVDVKCTYASLKDLVCLDCCIIIRTGGYYYA